MGSPLPSQKPAGDFVEVLSMLAHKFSQPLTSLRGSVEVALLGEVNQSECHKTLELVLQESHRMAELLSALRDVLDTEGSSEEVAAVSWTQSVESLLQEPAFANQKIGIDFVSNLQEEVWVKARPQQLAKATFRFLCRVFEAARGKSQIQVDLSADGKTACLSVCQQGGTTVMELGGRKSQPPFTRNLPEPAGLDDWIIRHAIERQGGGYEVVATPGTYLCYQLKLPVAHIRTRPQY